MNTILLYISVGLCIITIFFVFRFIAYFMQWITNQYKVQTRITYSEFIRHHIRSPEDWILGDNYVEYHAGQNWFICGFDFISYIRYHKYRTHCEREKKKEKEASVRKTITDIWDQEEIELNKYVNGDM